MRDNMAQTPLHMVAARGGDAVNMLEPLIENRAEPGCPATQVFRILVQFVSIKDINYASKVTSYHGNTESSHRHQMANIRYISILWK
jgi:glutaredoxin 2